MSLLESYKNAKSQSGNRLLYSLGNKPIQESYAEQKAEAKPRILTPKEKEQIEKEYHRAIEEFLNELIQKD